MNFFFPKLCPSRNFHPWSAQITIFPHFPHHGLELKLFLYPPHFFMPRTIVKIQTTPLFYSDIFFLQTFAHIAPFMARFFFLNPFHLGTSTHGELKDSFCPQIFAKPTLPHHRLELKFLLYPTIFLCLAQMWNPISCFSIIKPCFFSKLSHVYNSQFSTFLPTMGWNWNSFYPPPFFIPSTNVNFWPIFFQL